jgi:hypothetical protein
MKVARVVDFYGTKENDRRHSLGNVLVKMLIIESESEKKWVYPIQFRKKSFGSTPLIPLVPKILIRPKYSKSTETETEE